MYRKRAISNALVLAMIVTSLGTDYLSQAGVMVRAQAVVNVAEKMAARFTRVFPRRVQQSAVRLVRQNGPAEQLPAAAPCSPVLLHESELQLQLQYLPPPILA